MQIEMINIERYYLERGHLEGMNAGLRRALIALSLFLMVMPPGLFGFMGGMVRTKMGVGHDNLVTGQFGIELTS